ncbi:MAG: aminotransferase class V-fold PLP-dependent enzyme [Bacteroidota bacterium]
MTPQHNGKRLTINDLRGDIIGIDTMVPVLDGSTRRYTFLDNAASTPTFKRVWNRVGEFLPWYSGVHRGTGFKSQVATEAYDHAHDIAGRFVGADPMRNQVIFTKNTTECTNKLAARFQFAPGDVIITTGMEHHSNDLPWRRYARVVHVPVKELGNLDYEELKNALRLHKGKVRLVAVSGASNITGICSPIHDIAEIAHNAGAKIFVDAAQLVAHRPIDILPNDDLRHIDFLAYSAHKVYAPFGTGVLIGPTEFFAEGEPDSVGGGVAAIVTLDSVEWNPPPHKDEAGSPNVVGGIALAESLIIMKCVGMDVIAAHEQHLLEYALKKMKQIPGMVFYGPTEQLQDKVGVIAFNMEGIHPGLVASILSTEGAIGVRNGYFCAQPYVKRLLNVSAEAGKDTGCGVVATDSATFPGMARASFGCYSNEEDVDVLVEMLERIRRKEYKGTYIQNPATGAFTAEGFAVNISDYYPMVSAAEDIPDRQYSESA